MCLAVRPYGTARGLTGRIFMKFNILSISRKSVEKIHISLKSDKNDGHENLRTFMTINVAYFVKLTGL